MKVKIKKLNENAIIPKYAKSGDAGLDLTATSIIYDDKEDSLVYGTGLSVEIPEGFVGLVYPRSSISKYGLRLKNSVGVIDSGYRGEILLKFEPTSDYWEGAIEHEQFQESLENGMFLEYPGAEYKIRNDIYFLPTYKVGERVAQLIIMPYPQIEFEETDTLSETERNEGGFGSTNIVS